MAKKAAAAQVELPLARTGYTFFEAASDIAAAFDTYDGIEDEKEREAFVSEIQETFNQAIHKTDGFIAYARGLEGQIAMGKACRDAVIGRIAQLEGRLKRFKEYGCKAMLHAGRIKLEGMTGMILLSEGKSSLVIQDQKQVPARLKSVTVTMSAERWAEIAAAIELDPKTFTLFETVDGQAAKAELEAGGEVDGCDLKFGDDFMTIRDHAKGKNAHNTAEALAQIE